MIWGVTAGFAVLVLSSLTVLWVLQRCAPEPDRAQGAPVSWLADSVWRRLQPFQTRWLVGSVLVRSPTLTSANGQDHERVPRLSLKPGLPVPPEMKAQPALRALATMTGPSMICQPVWPYCCNRLATLISWQGGAADLTRIEQEAGPLDQAFLAEEFASWGGGAEEQERFYQAGWSEVLAMMRSGRHSGQGVNIFQCRACGRIYVASCAPSPDRWTTAPPAAKSGHPLG